MQEVITETVNVFGQIMKRIKKIDKTLIVSNSDQQVYIYLKSLGFDVQHFDLNGEDEFEFEDYTFDNVIAIDVLHRVNPFELFIEDVVRILIKLGLGIFIFPIKYCTDDLKRYLADFECNNTLRAIPSNLQNNKLDLCLLEIKKCNLK